MLPALKRVDAHLTDAEAWVCEIDNRDLVPSEVHDALAVLDEHGILYDEVLVERTADLQHLEDLAAAIAKARDAVRALQQS